MEEIKCKQVATLRGGKWEKTYEESRRVYGVDGLAPTVHTQGGGNQETKILVEPLAYDEQNGYLREDGIVGTITTDGSSPKHNNRVVEPIVIGNYHQSLHEASRIVSREGISPAVKENHGTITAVDEPRFFKQAFETIKREPCEIGDTVDAFNQKVNNSGVSPTVTTRPEGFKKAVLVVDEPKDYEYAGVAVHPVSKKLEFDGYKDSPCPTLLATDWKCPKTVLEEKAEPIIYDDFNGRIKADQTAISTLTTNCGNDAKGNGVKIIEPKQTDFRVRKLTERECFRLQGVKDTDFAKIRQNQSKSSCYHLAGDSITTSVLMALFGQMLGIDWRSKVDELVDELQGE